MPINAISFKADSVVSDNSENVSVNTQEEVKNDLARTPENDVFEPQQKKKKHLFRNISLGIVSALLLTYGGVVLHRKLSKPSFDEIQKCFKEIFQKDLSESEVKELVEKYKKICKEGKTDDFVNKMIEELKKDYGIEQVETVLNINRLKDNKLKTAMERTTGGAATPFGRIDINPGTSSDNVIRSVQKETFGTGFHELKHLQQFSEAYRANPEKFAEVCFEKNFPKEEFEKIVEMQRNEFKETAEMLHRGNPEEIRKWTEERGVLNGLTEAEKEQRVKDIAIDGKSESVDYWIKDLQNSKGITNEEDLVNFVKKDFIKSWREALDARFGKLTPYKEGTKEYERGMEYIKSYSEYVDASVDMTAYKNNLLEKEAYKNGDMAEKIYKYVSSIWKI